MSKTFDEVMKSIEDRAAKYGPVRKWLYNRSAFGMNGLAVIKPKNWTKILRSLRWDVKGPIQRARHNFSTPDIWDFFATNATAQIYALNKLKEWDTGYPMGSSSEEWHAQIDQMIDGFQAALDMDERPEDVDYKTWYEECQARVVAGMAVYAEHYTHLWD